MFRTVPLSETCRVLFQNKFEKLVHLLLLLLLLRWRYSPGWALASFIIRLQASRSLDLSPFVYSHLSQAHGHVIQPSHFWSSSSSCCTQLSLHLFWNCGVLHSFYVTKPSYSLAFNEPNETSASSWFYYKNLSGCTVTLM